MRYNTDTTFFSPPEKQPESTAFPSTPESQGWVIRGDQLVRETGGQVFFEVGSQPSAYRVYRGEAFPSFERGVLVTTFGGWNQPRIVGHELWLIPVSAEGNIGEKIKLLPANVGDRDTSDAAIINLSFFPEHPTALAIDRQGWIYVGFWEGRIIRLRPR
jgi:glucose/arabinose dehydrogenase